MDLLDLWRGNLSWRRLGVLIRMLPQESHFKTAVRNETPIEELRKRTSSLDSDFGPFSQLEMMVAEMIDELRKLVWLKTKWAEKGEHFPEPFPRPGAQRKDAELTPRTEEEAQRVLSILDHFRDNSGEVPPDFFARNEPEEP